MPNETCIQFELMALIFCSRFLYPGIVALTVASFTYPLGTGQFIAGELSTHEQGKKK